MRDMDVVALLVVGAMALVMGVLMGAAVVDAEWKRDCEQLGMTRAGSDVYECRVKK